ncbi:MAG: chloride channel protein, partial [Acidimicrobiales bacterium]
ASQLIWFTIIGVLGGLIGILYANAFYFSVHMFSRLSLPRWLRPALGGVIVGLIALVLPEVLGTGYGWIQQGLGPRLLEIPLWTVLLIPFARIVATGLSIGAGGSGGVFGPGMVIGAFIGASVWRVLDPIVPSLGHDPAPYVIVGMMACFGSISRAPFAVLIMVAEMTGSFSLLIPGMVALSIAMLIVHRNDNSIYRKQLRNRAESRQRRVLATLPRLGSLTTSQAMTPPQCLLYSSESVSEALRDLRSHNVDAAPLLDSDHRLVGVVNLTKLLNYQRANHDDGSINLVRLVSKGWSAVHQDLHLDGAVDALTTWELSWVPVTDDQGRLVGTISLSDIMRAYHEHGERNPSVMASQRGTDDPLDIRIGKDSSLVGKTLRLADLPHGILIVSLWRDGVAQTPSGDATFAPDDLVFAVGSSSELEAFQRLAVGAAH